MIIVNTRSEIFRRRIEDRKTMTMTKERKAASVLAFGALSRRHPHRDEYVNVVNAVSDLPTPDRADEVMDYAEDALLLKQLEG